MKSLITTILFGLFLAGFALTIEGPEGSDLFLPAFVEGTLVVRVIEKAKMEQVLFSKQYLTDKDSLSEALRIGGRFVALPENQVRNELNKEPETKTWYFFISKDSLLSSPYVYWYGNHLFPYYSFSVPGSTYYFFSYWWHRNHRNW